MTAAYFSCDVYFDLTMNVFVDIQMSRDIVDENVFLKTYQDENNFTEVY